MRTPALVTFLVPVVMLCGSVARPGETPPQTTILERIASSNPSDRKQATEAVLKQRTELIAGLLRIINDAHLRKTNRPAVVSAIEVLGELRAAEAAPALVSLLRFGRKKDFAGGAIQRMTATHKETPAVQALIRIGLPSLEPVTAELLAIPDVGQLREGQEYVDVIDRHCCFVIKGVLGPKLGKAYLRLLMDSNEKARMNKRIQTAPDFMDLHAK